MRNIRELPEVGRLGFPWCVCCSTQVLVPLVQVVPLSEAPPPKGTDCGAKQEKSLLGQRIPGDVQTNTAVAGSITLPGHSAFLWLFYSSLQNRRSDPDPLSRDEEHHRALCINTAVILIPPLL